MFPMPLTRTKICFIIVTKDVIRMKKVLKKIFVNYGGIIFFYLTIIIATFSLISDYKMYDKENNQTTISTAETLNI